MRTLLLLLSIFIFAIELPACKKNNDAPTPSNLNDSLNVINASTNTINFYLNGTRLNNNSNLYPGGSSGYYYVPQGAQTYQIKEAFNSSTSIVQTLFNFPVTLNAHHYYSLFVTGETAAQAFYTVDTLKQDDSTNTCYVRFVNSSPTAGSLDLAVGDTVQFTKVGFKSATGFKLVSVNLKADSLKPIKVFQSGSATPIISGHVNLTPGYSYTFYSKGSLTGTGSTAFALGTTINFN